MALWMMSFPLDSIIRGYVCQLYVSRSPVLELKRIFWVLIVKDAVITIMAVTLVLLVQFGTYNSCWCRSSFRGIVNLMGYSPPEWKRAKLLWCTLPLGGLTINLALILWVELSSKGGTPLCKHERELDGEWAQLRVVTRVVVNSDIPESNGAGDEGGVELMEFRSEPNVSDGERIRLLDVQLPFTDSGSAIAIPDYLLPSTTRNDPAE